MNRKTELVTVRAIERRRIANLIHMDLYIYNFDN